MRAVAARTAVVALRLLAPSSRAAAAAAAHCLTPARALRWCCTACWRGSAAAVFTPLSAAAAWQQQHCPRHRTLVASPCVASVGIAACPRTGGEAGDRRLLEARRSRAFATAASSVGRVVPPTPSASRRFRRDVVAAGRGGAAGEPEAGQPFRGSSIDNSTAGGAERGAETPAAAESSAAAAPAASRRVFVTRGTQREGPPPTAGGVEAVTKGGQSQAEARAALLPPPGPDAAAAAGQAATPGSGEVTWRLTDISGERFRKRERLSGNTNFQRVQRVGLTHKTQHFRIVCASNVGLPDATCTRVGIVTPKKNLRRAVDRVLMRRRFRDIFRKNKAAWPARVDMVINVFDSALQADYAELRALMLEWAAGYAAAARRQPRGGGGSQARGPPGQPGPAGSPGSRSGKPSSGSRPLRASNGPSGSRGSGGGGSDGGGGSGGGGGGATAG